jgi:hypothetical protein
MIDPQYLPSLDNSDSNWGGVPLRHEDPGLYVHGNEYDSSGSHAGNPNPIVAIHYVGVSDPAKRWREFLVKYGWTTIAGQTEQKKFPSIPPFYALAWIKFVGY